jgi:molybdate transport repressor ModE-like protein
VTGGWSEVEIRHLLALEAIARTGSFRAAATELGYAPSAVSQQLSQLERLVGARLIERAPGTAPIVVTEAGRTLVEHTTAVLERFDAARSGVKAVLDGRAGILRVGAFQSAATRLLPEVLPRFARSCPDTDVEITERCTDAQLFELVERGELDLAFCQLPVADGPFEYAELLDDPFVLLVPADSPIAEREDAPSAAEIAEMPLVHSDHNPTVQGLVAEGVGVAVVPRLVVDPHDPGTRTIELAEPPPRTVALLWHSERGRTRPAELFVDAVRSVCARTGTIASERVA